MNLFRLGHFNLHSGGVSRWKIDCDALTDLDWQALAVMAVERLPPFGKVEGIPQGGLRFAEALRQYATQGPVLIVDDVATTGNSFKDQRAGREDVIGVVIFARGKCPPWVTALFTLGSKQG
jgi:hypothetical protein